MLDIIQDIKDEFPQQRVDMPASLHKGRVEKTDT